MKTQDEKRFDAALDTVTAAYAAAVTAWSGGYWPSFNEIEALRASSQNLLDVYKRDTDQFGTVTNPNRIPRKK